MPSAAGPVRSIGAFAIVLLAGGAYAQDAGTLQLTLEEAQARAIDTSHRLAEGRARERTAQAVVDSREAADRPVVSAQAGYQRTNHVPEFALPSPAATGGRLVVYPDVPNNFRSRIDLQWPIFNGGRTDALTRAARADAAAVTAETDTARADLRLEVARAFWAVVTAKAAVSVLERGVARAQAHVVDVRERLNAGLISPNELASAEAQESRERMLLIEARSQRDIASSDLGRLVIDDPLRTVEPSAALEAGVSTAPDASGAVAIALESRPERTGLERRIDAAGELRTAAAAGRLPMISVTGGYDVARPNPRIFPRTELWNDSWDAAINLTWSLWDGGRVDAEVAQAASQAEAARERLKEFDSQLTVEVRQRLLEIDSGRAAVSAADDAVRAATEAQRVVTERYRAGVITQIEVLDAEFALLQAELDRTRALAGVRLAEARLARAMGR
ncbi:MAG TPA: TolC family protein [Vicinamibacterales bacterium]|nr:TolC family protein [Vicinamibacterales bacterium]